MIPMGSCSLNPGSVTEKSECLVKNSKHTAAITKISPSRLSGLIIVFHVLTNTDVKKPVSGS
jgi:hypothetical protein